MNPRRALILSIWLVLAAPAPGHTYVQLGVASNFLIDDGKVYFAQSDRTLTALNVETGEVVARKRNLRYGGTLQLAEGGILMRCYPELTLLDRARLEVLWQVKRAEDSIIEGHRVVSDDGSGRVTCRDLRTGKALWSYNLPGALDIVVQKAKVLVFRSAEYDGATGVPAVVLLDLESGKELLHKTTPPHEHFLQAYFDGDRIYLPAGAYKGEYTPDVTRYDSGRPSARFEKLVVWDLGGNEIESTPVPVGFKEHEPDREKAFQWGDKVFARGLVWKSLQEIPQLREGQGRAVNRELSEDNKEVTVTRFDLADGSVSIKTTADVGAKYRPEAESTTEVEFESHAGTWRGSLPYLKNPGAVVAVAATAKQILLGTNLGHVEAINRQNGRSQWIYVFPTIRHTTSSITGYGPPLMAEAAATFQRENQHKTPESGLLLEGATGPSQPRVIFDPEPTNPYRKLNWYLAIAWTCALLPLVLTALVIRSCERRHLDKRVPAGAVLALTLGAVAGFLYYGGVSLGSSAGLRLGIVGPLVVTFAYALQTLMERRWVSGALILLAALAIGIFLGPAILGL